MKKSFFIVPVLWLILLCVPPAQVLAEDAKQTFSQAELDQMLAPVALYPDSLLSQIFMASTYPASVAEAVKWSESNPAQKGDAAVTAVQDKAWDPSVMSLVAFPQVMAMMGEKPDWVQDLGDAFLADPNSVMDSVQKLRTKAKDKGNLKTNEQQTIIVEQASSSSPEIIVIEPAQPTVIYVPTYNPVTVYGSWWYPSYPPYYYNPVGSALVAGVSFGIGVGIVNSLWGGCNWGRGDVDINVNRYNNINVNNKLDASKRTSNWNHNSKNRGGTPYRDRSSQRKYNNKSGSLDKRQDFRGRDTNKNAGRNTRDAERQRAQASLKQRGNDPAAARKQLSGAGGDKVRNQVNKADRSQLSNRSNSIGSNNRDRMKRSGSENLRNNNTRDRAKSSNLSKNRSRSSSLSGIGSQRSSSNFNRGSRSRGSFGGGSRGGGGRGRR